MKEYAFGIDLGGTTAKVGLFTTSGALLEKWEVPTDTSNAGEHILENLANAIRGKMAEKEIPAEQVEGVGIGVPGPVLNSSVVPIVCANLGGWGERNVSAQLSGLLDGLRVLVGNDANVAALGGKATQAERGDVMNYYTQIEPESADLIISNPPYLTAREMQNLMPETAREPAMALDGGADGLDFYRVLVRQYYDAVRPGGWLVLEIGYAQAEAVLELGKAAGWQAGTCRKDAGGNDRVVFFRKPLENPV